MPSPGKIIIRYSHTSRTLRILTDLAIETNDQAREKASIRFNVGSRV